jgi:WhiB family transcriptional regulator, redox-sensing transcriptional regulator
MLPVDTRTGPQGWMSRGACKREDPEMFFPVATTGPALRQIRTAKAVCFRCTVCATCLAYALENMQDGIWGGTTEQERRAILVARSRAARRGAEPADRRGAREGATAPS